MGQGSYSSSAIALISSWQLNPCSVSTLHGSRVGSVIGQRLAVLRLGTVALRSDPIEHYQIASSCVTGGSWNCPSQSFMTLPTWNVTKARNTPIRHKKIKKEIYELCQVLQHRINNTTKLTLGVRCTHQAALSASVRTKLTKRIRSTTLYV